MLYAKRPVRRQQPKTEINNQTTPPNSKQESASTTNNSSETNTQHANHAHAENNENLPEHETQLSLEIDKKSDEHDDDDDNEHASKPSMVMHTQSTSGLLQTLENDKELQQLLNDKRKNIKSIKNRLEFYVNPNNHTTQPDGKKWTTAFASVQQAIDAISQSQAQESANRKKVTIYLAAEEYTTGFAIKNITLNELSIAGGYNPQTGDQTDDAQSVFTGNTKITIDHSNDVTIDNIAVQNITGSTPIIDIKQSNEIYILNSEFTANSTTGSPMIQMSQSNPTVIDNSQFTNNTTANSLMLHVLGSGSELTIKDSVFEENKTEKNINKSYSDNQYIFIANGSHIYHEIWPSKNLTQDNIYYEQKSENDKKEEINQIADEKQDNTQTNQATNNVHKQQQEQPQQVLDPITSQKCPYLGKNFDVVLYVAQGQVGDGSSWEKAIPTVQHAVEKIHQQENGSEKRVLIAISFNNKYGNNIKYNESISINNIKLKNLTLQGGYSFGNLCQQKKKNTSLFQGDSVTIHVKDSSNISMKQLQIANYKQRGLPLPQKNSLIQITTSKNILLQDISIENKQTEKSLIIINSSNDVKMNKFKLKENKSESNIVSIINSSSEVTIKNSKFHSNKTKQSGGAVAIADSKNIEIKNTKFQNNTTKKSGGAISVAGGSEEVTIQNVTFQGNKAKKSGGDVYIVSSAVKIHNSTFTGPDLSGDLESDKRAQDGGAVSISLGDNNQKSVDIANSTFAGNMVPGHGGAAIIHLSDNNAGNVNITGCSFDDNAAFKAGGALAAEFGKTNSGKITVGEGTKSCRFSSNISSAGGAIFATGLTGQKEKDPAALLIIDKCKFEKNEANDDSSHDIYLNLPVIKLHKADNNRIYYDTGPLLEKIKLTTHDGQTREVDP